MPEITLQSVEKSFGDVKALDKLDLNIREGEVHALLGHNGAGKTTTLRILLGLNNADHGVVSVFGHDPTKDGDAVRAMCGVLSEDVGLYEPLSLLDNLIFYAEIFGLPRPVYMERIDELLQRFDIGDKKHLPVSGFSTGMKKKAALVRALLHRPQILLLDEPTSGLDPVATVDLRGMLQELVREQNTTILLTTHNLDEVEKLCDRISIFRHGRNILTGEIGQFRERPEFSEDGQFSLEKLYLSVEERGENA